MDKQKSLWKEKMMNLMERRKSGGFIKKNPVTGNYPLHFTKIKIGTSILDVGCGEMDAGKALAISHPNSKYVGLDPFPMDCNIVNGKIEEVVYGDKSFDTILAFASLDGIEDMDKALANMNCIAALNIGILTGIGIEPDKYHTFKITEELLVGGLKDFEIKYREELLPKVFLYDFWRK